MRAAARFALQGCARREPVSRWRGLRAASSLAVFSLGVLLLGTTAGAQILPQPLCTVEDGSFHHVWGGLVRDVFALDTQQRAAWLVEDGGRIRRTFDGGATWVFQDTPPCVQDLLRGAHFLHNGPVREGWAVGDGVVLHTTTAGGSWSQIASLEVNNQPAELWDVYFLDPSVGFLAGNHVLKSSVDGGATWAEVSVSNPYDPGFDASQPEYYSVDLQPIGDGLLGVAVAEPGLIVRTTDGFNWSVAYDFCFAPPLCSQCAPSAPIPPVAGCANGFEIWDVEIVPGATSVATAEVIAVGGFGNQCGQFLTSQDGGKTWGQEWNVDGLCNTQVAACGGSGLQDGVPTQYGDHALIGGGAISVGYGGTNIVRDTNCSPPVWRPNTQIQESGTGMKLTQPLFAVDGSGGGIAWLGSMMNGVAKTVDGGASWSVETAANDVFRLQDVFFKSATEGWAVGQGFRITKTTDGGVNWLSEQLPSGAAAQGGLNDIVFDANGLDGVAVGGFFGSDATKISVTGTGGPPWGVAQTITPPLGAGNRTLSSVTATGNRAFWAAGATATVLFSANGGVDWENVGVDTGGGAITSVTLNGVAFLDPNTGFVVGRQGATGKIYQVTNATNPATRAWLDVSPPGSESVTDLQGVAAGGGAVYAVGKRLGAAGSEVAVVYRWTGTSFVRELTPAVDACPGVSPTAGSPFRALAGLFNEVAVAPGGNTVFVGGSCGRFLRRDATGWQELKSHTSMHVSGMSFYAQDGGFVHATMGSHGVIVQLGP